MDIKVMFEKENEKPLDIIKDDGGFCSIFRTIGCIGDSLSSGEFESTDGKGNKGYHDYFEYSWGQYIARMTGSKVYNFSRGGMTAEEYCNSFAEKNGFWDKDKACRAYIIALGVNDLYGRNMEIGSLADICDYDPRKNKPTFAGYYAQIVSRMKDIEPDAKFFFMTMPREDKNEYQTSQGDAHAELLYELANYFNNAYVIDLRKYGPVYDGYFKNKFYLGGHMNACGYVLTAKMVASYIDYIVRHNMDDFRQIGFVGTPFRNQGEI